MVVEKPNYSITRMARLLEVSRSGFYAWQGARNHPCVTKLRRSQLDRLVFDVFYENDGEYGSIRIHRALIDSGEKVSVTSVERSMRRQGLRASCKRTYTKALPGPSAKDRQEHGVIAAPYS